MRTPNLFAFATSELSQDAFVCWLASWADPALKDQNEALLVTATAFLARLLEVGKGPKMPEYRSIQVRRQESGIDVLLVVNGDTAIIIEDKTDTKDHSDQLRRYKTSVADEFPKDRIAAVYLKTGDQCDYQSVDEAGYGRFLRKDFLNILDRGDQSGVRNEIFADFRRHLHGIENAVQSFASCPVQEWNNDWRRWNGFFMALKERLGDGGWGYVANPGGGFMGSWWHSCDGKYLQLNMDNLHFMITIPEIDKARLLWESWNSALFTKNGTNGITIKKTRQERGKWMRVAELVGGYLQTDTQQGRLDFDKTVDFLRKVENFMDAAMEVERTTLKPVESNGRQAASGDEEGA